MLLPPAMRDQDPQPSQPFGERKPRPEEIEAQKRAELNKAPAVGKSTNLPTPPQHINDHEMIRRDILPPSSGLIPSLEALAREVIALVFNVKPRIAEDAGVPIEMRLYRNVLSPQKVSEVCMVDIACNPEAAEDIGWKSSPPPAQGWYIASNAELANLARFWHASEQRWSYFVRHDREQPRSHLEWRKKQLMSDDATRNIKWLRPVTGVDLP